MRPFRRHRVLPSSASSQRRDSGARPTALPDEIGSDGGLARTVARLSGLDRNGRAFGSAVQSLLRRVRVVPPLPRRVRERALARARAALAAPVHATNAVRMRPAGPRSTPSPRLRRA